METEKKQKQLLLEIAAVCEVVKESCGLTSISATDIHYAQRLKSKLPGLRPVLVSFMTLAMRGTV